MRIYSYENDFDLHENRRADKTYFNMNGFVRRLILKQSQTRKWPCVWAVQIMLVNYLLWTSIPSRWGGGGGGGGGVSSNNLSCSIQYAVYFMLWTLELSAVINLLQTILVRLC